MGSYGYITKNSPSFEGEFYFFDSNPFQRCIIKNLLQIVEDYFYQMVPEKGLEPLHLSAYAPQAYMSTIPSPGQKLMVHPVGFEPTTNGFEDRYSSN